MQREMFFIKTKTTENRQCVARNLKTDKRNVKALSIRKYGEKSNSTGTNNHEI